MQYLLITNWLTWSFFWNQILIPRLLFSVIIASLLTWLKRTCKNKEAVFLIASQASASFFDVETFWTEMGVLSLVCWTLRIECERNCVRKYSSDVIRADIWHTFSSLCTKWSAVSTHQIRWFDRKRQVNWLQMLKFRVIKYTEHAKTDTWDRIQIWLWDKGLLSLTKRYSKVIFHI